MNNLFLSRFIVVIIFLILTYLSASIIISNCESNYIYPLDDTYIHLSISKNLAEKGIWGVTGHEFTSSSSSILYTLILSLFTFIGGSNDILPLIINIFISYFIILFLYSFFKPVIFISGKEKTNQIASLLILSLIVLTLIIEFPLVALTMSGMEHSLQILINLTFINLFIRYISENESKALTKLYLISILVPLVRYEGIFIIALALFFLILKKEYKNFWKLMIFSSSAIIFYGIISIYNGWYFLPNSILLKSNKPTSFDIISIINYILSWVIKLISEKHLLTIVISSSAILWFNLKLRLPVYSNRNLWLVFTLVLIPLHLAFAKTGWVYRYEAYLVAIGLISIMYNSIEIFKYADLKLRNLIVVMMLLTLFANGLRAYDSLVDVPTMSKNIYHQQYQMAKFISKYNNKSTVVLGDIGACCYYTDIKLIDLVALGSLETLKLKIDKKFTKKEIFKLAESKNAEIAILYKDAFSEFIPEQWIELESWKISDNKGCFKDIVTFYSIKTEKFIEQKLNLEEFSKDLPIEVQRLNN